MLLNPIFTDPATQSTMVSIKHVKVIIGRQMLMNEMPAAHAIAYESLKSFMKKEIICSQIFMPLSVLLDHYIHQRV